MGETSLLVFSFCLQAAIGITIFLTIAKQFSKDKDKEFKPAALCAAVLSVIGIVASLTHLGRPMSFLNSLSHLGGSWLSNEALLSGIFAGLAVVYAVLLYVKAGQSFLGVLRWAASIIGLVTVFSMAKLYTTTVVPVWQGLNTFVDFYATTVAAGALLFVAFSLKELKDEDKRIYGLIALAAVIIQAASAVPHALSLAAEGMAAQSSAAILTSMSAAVGLKWLLVLGGAGFLLWLFVRKPEAEGRSAAATGTMIIYVACAALIIGQVIGRFIFYAAMVAVGIGLT